MTCSDFTSRIDEYLDGRLRPEDEEVIRKHIAECPACAEEADAGEDLRRRAARLPRSLDPPQDLWPEIATRIAAERVVRGRFGRRALMAAAAVALIAGSVVTAYLVGRGQAVTTVENRQMLETGPSEIVLASFQELGVSDYLVTRSTLFGALDARRDDLSPETLEVLMANLKVIDDAMGKIAEALGEEPGNEFLMKQLAAAYRRQINLLETAVRLPAEV
jgi:anti-sigma factor (TIGR02949 family)